MHWFGKAMNIPYKKISVLLLLSLTTAGAFADIRHGNGNSGFWGRFNGNNAQQNENKMRKDELQHQRQLNKQANQNNLLERCKDTQHSGERACGVIDPVQKRNGLTAEEKRALRQQIQDARNQLYTPKH